MLESVAVVNVITTMHSSTKLGACDDSSPLLEGHGEAA